MIDRKLLLGILLVGVSAILHSCKPTEHTPAKPNILFIAIDDMADWMGAMGGHPQAITPNMDKLAHEGVLFTNAHTPAPACSPCRNAILYGLQPHKSGLYPFYDRAKMDPAFFKSHKSMMQIFMDNGYNTYGAGKVHHGNQKPASIAMFDSLEFTESINARLRDLPVLVVDSLDGVGPKTYNNMSARPSISPLEDHKDYNISLFGVDVIKRKHEKPFFLAVGFTKPHLPFIAPKKYFDMFPMEEIQKTPVKDHDLADLPWAARRMARLHDDYNFRTADEWEGRIRAYLACIAYTDENVGRVVDALNSSEYKDNTIIVLWSDHGYHLGEKRSFRKFSLWEESTRVPFIILDPRNESNGKECSAPVSLIDIYPTLLNYAGIELPAYSDGLDLRDLLKDPGSDREIPALTTWGRGNYSLRSSKWRYTRYFDGSEELYDHENDPNEWDNLAQSEEYDQVKNELKQYLPSEEAPLVLQGKYLHNISDADQPSMEKFKELWKIMQERGLNLE